MEKTIKQAHTKAYNLIKFSPTFNMAKTTI
jgi:hypothetical protein